MNGTTNTSIYGYDQEGRLDAVTENGNPVASYGYDQNGNRVSVNAAMIAGYDNQDRLLTYGSNSYTYNANGELLTKTTPTGTTDYTWDALGNLAGVKLPTGTDITYLYDGQNRRIGKEVNGKLTEGFLYDGQLEPVAELDGSGNIVEQFVYGTRPNVPDYIIKGGVEYRVIADQVSSPILIVNANTGAIVEQIGYDAWGNVISDSNPGFQPFGFAGGLYDPDTGLVHFGARDYDPETGRWITKDPARFSGGDTNLYGYVVSDPINAFDPLGLWAFGDPLPQGLVNAAAGFGDALSFGLTDLARNALGTNDVVNHCSGAYGIAHDVGTAYALAFGVGRLAYAGAANALPLMIRSAGSEEERALAISAARNTLKQVFRGDITRSSTYKIYNPAAKLQEYNNDPTALISASTRTDPILNLAGAAAVAGAIASAGQNCGCSK